MPLYEYQCEACGNRFEKIQKFSDPPLESCPACGGAVRKLVSSPAFQFKGSGWYVTDYARSGKTDTGAGEDAKPAADKGAPTPAADTAPKADTTKEPKESKPSPDAKAAPSSKD